MRKPITMLVSVGLLFGSLTAGHASTKLLWRTPASGIKIVPNPQSTLVPIDVTAGELGAFAFFGKPRSKAASAPAAR